MSEVGKQERIVEELLLRLLEGDLDDQGLETLKSWFDQDEAANLYLEFVKNYTAIKLLEEARVQDEIADSSMHTLLAALAAEERDAPEVPMPKVIVESPEPEPPPVRPETPRRIERLSIYMAILTSAALLFFVAYAHLAAMLGQAEVATLQDTINARWADAGEDLAEGMRLVTGQTAQLLGNGYAKLLFDNGAVVTIEGPAEFKIVSDDRIRLQQGRLYSIVPNEAIGFTVDTPSATVMDLGTQFGVQVDGHSNTELHVSQGKTRLETGPRKQRKVLEVIQGSARRVASATSVVTEIPLHDSFFVRQINSRTNLIWRGNNRLSLADVVGGGNGWGSGQTEVGIDPLTGIRGSYQVGDRVGNRVYVPVTTDSYVDGVFVPDGEKAQVVSSQGHVCAQLPDTNNVFYSDVIAGAGSLIAVFEGREPHGLLGGRYFGTPEYPALLMHANLGITFDLAAIRDDLPDGEIAFFTADAGLSSDRPRLGNAEMWVLVDGAVAFSTQVDSSNQVVAVNVPLKPSVRFLSLVVTDGRDEDKTVGGSRATDSDWSVWGQPELVLTTP